MWLILVPVLQGGFEDEVSCTLAFRAVVLLPLLSPMTLFTWVWDGEKDTLHLQHLSPPALSKYAPASVQWVVKVQHPYCCEICFGDEGDGDSKHRCTGTRLIKYICDSDSVVSRALHSRPVVRLFASQNSASAKRCWEAAPVGSQESHLQVPQALFQMQGPGKSSQSITWSLSFPDLAQPTGHWIATTEHTSPGAHAGSGNTWEEIEVLCGILTTLACLGYLVLLTSQDPGFSRSGEAVIPSTPKGSGCLWNINTKNWAEWGSIPHLYFPKERLPTKL